VRGVVPPFKKTKRGYMDVEQVYLEMLAEMCQTPPMRKTSAYSLRELGVSKDGSTDISLWEERMKGREE